MVIINYFSLLIFIFILGAQLWLRFFINRHRFTQKKTHQKSDFKRNVKILSFIFYHSFLHQRFWQRNLFRVVFCLSVVAIFFLLFYQSYQQYQIWSQNEISKFLLPPYQSVSYFIFFVFSRFFAPYLISLGIALFFLFAAKIFNKRYEERFFYSEEYYFGALAIFLLSHPGWLFYVVILLFFYLLFSIFYFLFSKKQERLSFYYFWLSTGIFVIIIQRWLELLPLWELLKF